MKYLKLFEELDSKYIGQCDRIRKTSEGETFWHELIKNQIKISKEEFLVNVNIYDILDQNDPDDTLEGFVGTDTNTYYAYSIVNGSKYYFLSTYGFEFIWKKF